MAIKTKSKIAATKTPKPPKISRAAAKSIDLQYNGTEPLDISIKGYQAALNWYNYVYDVDQARDWVLDYMKRNGYSKTDIADFRRASKYRIPTTIGWQARIMMNGNVLESASMDFFNSRLSEVIEAGRREVVDEPVVADTPSVPTPSIQDRIRAKNDALLSLAEVEVVDERGVMYDFLMRHEATASAANHLKAFYQASYDEVMSEDEQVKEAFGKRLKAERVFWQSVMDDLDRYVGNKKATKVRKPREKKQKSAVEMVKGLNFQKEFAPLKIVSINPAEIIGASQLWAYNTKTRKLTKFDAVGPNGLQVKGASIIGFDVEKSSTKRLRKPDTTIQSLLGAGKVTLRRFMEEVKSVASEAKGRINSDTILLRVVK